MINIDKNPIKSARGRKKQISEDFVKLTVDQGRSDKSALRELDISTEELNSITTQAEIQRLLEQRRISGEELNSIISAKLIEIGLTSPKEALQLRALQALSTRKDVKWAPEPEKQGAVSIEITIANERATLLADVLDNLPKYDGVFDATPKRALLDSGIIEAEVIENS